MDFNPIDQNQQFVSRGRRRCIVSADIHGVSVKHAPAQPKMDSKPVITIVEKHDFPLKEEKFLLKFQSKMNSLFSSNMKRVVSVVLSFVIIASGTVFASNIRVGYEIYIDNKSVGIIEEKEEAQIVVEKIRSELQKASSSEQGFEQEPIYNPRFALANKISSVEQIETNIKASLDYYVDGCRIVIDGNEAVSVENEQIAAILIQEFKDGIKSNGIIESAEIISEIEMIPDKVLFSSLKEKSAAMQVLDGTAKAQENLYTIKEKDTLWDIAVSNDVPVSYLLEINEGLSDVLKVGEKIYINAPQQLIKIKLTERLSFEEAIPHEVELRKDASIAAGKIEVVQKGSDGKRYIEAIVERIGNEEIGREILKEEIYSMPVTQIEKVGTKKADAYKSTGNFIRPVGGSVSSRFGKRGKETHTGIDYACSYGVKIKAADSGEVVQVGYYGGYGKMVKIDHGNGYETLYAHCSTLDVKVGQKVKKGEIIAAVGSTGNSTGPHLHFEIRKGGIPQDPDNYI